MINVDREQLTDLERRVLDDAFNPNASPRRTRGLILSALVVTTGVALFTAFGASIIFLAGLTLATLVVSSSEKFVYQRNMEAYESLIRKLVERLQVDAVSNNRSTTTNVKSDTDLSDANVNVGLQQSGFRETLPQRQVRNWS